MVSIDAMGTHPDTAVQIHEADGEYILALKANQKAALKTVAARVAALDAAAGCDRAALEDGQYPGNLLAPGPLAEGQSVELSHGRFEQRLCIVLRDLSFFHMSWKWAGLKSVVRVIRTTQRGGRDSVRSSALATETHYYLSSLSEHAAAHAARIRAHWSVENTCHHLLDVIFREDHCQVHERSAAHCLSILREASAKVLRDHLPEKSIRSKRKRAAMDPAFRSELLASIAHPFDA